MSNTVTFLRTTLIMLTPKHCAMQRLIPGRYSSRAVAQSEGLSLVLSRPRSRPLESLGVGGTVRLMYICFGRLVKRFRSQEPSVPRDFWFHIFSRTLPHPSSLAPRPGSWSFFDIMPQGSPSDEGCRKAADFVPACVCAHPVTAVVHRAISTAE